MTSEQEFWCEEGCVKHAEAGKVFCKNCDSKNLYVRTGDGLQFYLNSGSDAGEDAEMSGKRKNKEVTALVFKIVLSLVLLYAVLLTVIRLVPNTAQVMAVAIVVGVALWFLQKARGGSE